MLREQIFGPLFIELAGDISNSDIKLRNVIRSTKLPSPTTDMPVYEEGILVSYCESESSISRQDLQSIRDRMLDLAGDNGASRLWKIAYLALASAADALDAMMDRSELNLLQRSQDNSYFFSSASYDGRYEDPDDD